MSKLEIDLPPALTEFVNQQVEAGLYHSAEEVILDAVRRQSEEIWPPVESVRAALARGVAEADAGIFFDGSMDDIIAEARGAAPKRK